MELKLFFQLFLEDSLKAVLVCLYFVVAFRTSTFKHVWLFKNTTILIQSFQHKFTSLAFFVLRAPETFYLDVLEAKFRNGVGSIPVVGNSPSTGVWIV